MRRPSAAKILAAAPHGKRHNTMVGAAMALAMRGYSDAAIFAALDDAYYLVNDLSIEEAIAGGLERHPLGQGMRRARRRDDHRDHGAGPRQHRRGLEQTLEARVSLLDAFDLVIGIDTEYVSGENLDGVPYDENAVLSYQAFYFHPATGRSNGGYYMTNGPGRRNRHALTSLISRDHQRRTPRRCRHPWRLEGRRREGTGRETAPQDVEAEEPAHRDHRAFHASRPRHVLGFQEPEEILRPRQGDLRLREAPDHPRNTGCRTAPG